MIKNEVDIIDHDVPGYNKIERGIFKLLRYGDLDYAYVLKNRKHFKGLNKGSRKIVLQFAEILKNSESLDSYLYIDMDVASVKYLYEHSPQVFQYSNYATCNKSAIDRRSKLQLDYMRHCSGVFTMGRWLREELVSLHGLDPKRMHHAGGGINMRTELIDDTHKEGNKLLFVGRDFERKGGYVVFHAFEKLRRRRPEVELYVAGPATDPIDHPVEGYYYMGDCTYEQTAQLYNKCDVFCLPSYFEAYGLVFVEALTFGLPCIGRNTCEMPYLIEDGKTGFLIEDDDADKLSEKMEILLDSTQIKENVCSKRNWYIGEYSWDTVAKRIIAAMKEDHNTK
jgi:glycosyltransferase involved in cell wall biosynthesis